MSILRAYRRGWCVRVRACAVLCIVRRKQKRAFAMKKVAAKKTAAPTVVDRRKLSALSALLLDVPIEELGHRVQSLEAALHQEKAMNGQLLSTLHKSKKPQVCHFHPMMSPQASELRKELIGIAISEGKRITQANALTSTEAYHQICSNAELSSVICFPPKMHADAARRGCKLGYRLYHNEFLGLIHAERSNVAESKAINRLVLTCLTTSASATGLERRMQKSLETRSQLQMDRVPCEHFGHCVMAQTGYAIDCFLDELADKDPTLARRPEDLCYLRFMARAMFDEEGRHEVCALYDTKHTSVENNAAAMQHFLSERTARLGLKRCAAALSAPDRLRTLYAGLIGSIVANSLIAAYVLRCETAAPSKVQTYTDILQADYERTKFCIDTVALPGCVRTLGPGASLDKRLLILNAFDRITSTTDGPNLRPRTIHIVNNVISSIQARHNEADGVSDRPIRNESEYSFNHFNDMSTYAVSEVVTGIVAAL